ncbi:MAG: MliC family protein [Microvirgula sp.]
MTLRPGLLYPALLAALLAAPVAKAVGVDRYRCDNGVRFTVRDMPLDLSGLTRVDLRYRDRHYLLTPVASEQGSRFENAQLVWQWQTDPPGSALFWRGTDGEHRFAENCRQIG